MRESPSYLCVFNPSGLQPAIIQISSRSQGCMYGTKGRGPGYHPSKGVWVP